MKMWWCAALALSGCFSFKFPQGPGTTTPGCVVVTSCAAQSAVCGTVPDGCGRTLSCGTCASSQTCNASNTCVTPSPATPTLASASPSQVRQGGNATIVLSGTALDTVTAVALKDSNNAAVTVSVSAGQQSSTALSLTVTVRDGAALGAVTVQLTSPGGIVSSTTALSITAITAGPSGSDSTGAGTTAAPVRSVTAALALAQAGDTVQLLTGTYDAAHGEVWPTTTADAWPNKTVAGANVPAGIALQGVGTVTLVGPGGGLANHTNGLTIAGNAAVQNVDLAGFEHGVFVFGGDAVTLTDVSSHDNDADGLFIAGATTHVSVTASASGASSFYNNGNSVCDATQFCGTVSAVTTACQTAADGIATVNGAQLTGDGLDIHDNAARGLSLTGGTTSLSHSQIHSHPGNNECNDASVFILSASTFTFDTVEIFDSGWRGIEAAGEAHVVLLNSNLHELKATGVEMGDKGTLVATNTSFTNTTGIYMGGDVPNATLTNCVFRPNETPIAVTHLGIEIACGAFKATVTMSGTTFPLDSGSTGCTTTPGSSASTSAPNCWVFDPAATGCPAPASSAIIFN